MATYSKYTDSWARQRYVEIRPEEFTYNPARSEEARAVEADPTRLQHVDTVDSPTDGVATDVAADWHGLSDDGFPDHMWDGGAPTAGADEMLVDRSTVDYQARGMDNGAPAHRLRRTDQLEDVTHTYRSGHFHDPENYLRPDPVGEDADRLIRAGHGAFNAYAGNNSYVRNPMEWFRREDRDMHDPAGLDFASVQDVRPLWYNKAATPVGGPMVEAEHRNGFVYNAWDTFVDEYLPEAPYDRGDPGSPAFKGEDNAIDLNWGW